MATAKKPTADALSRNSALAWQAGEAATAEAFAREALRLDPGHAGAHTNLGAILRGTGRGQEAEAEFRAALAADPFLATAISNLGAMLAAQGRGPEAESLYRRAIALEPKHPSAHNNLGLFLLDSGRFDEAIEVLRVAAKLDAKNGDVLNNLGAALQARGHFAEAIKTCTKAMELAPTLDIAKLNVASMLLAQGDFARGWPLYEARLSPRIETNRQDIPELPFPRWQGEPLQGKTFLIWPEQGFGDEIQFVRYATLLKQRGAKRVAVRCKPALADLMREAKDVDRVVTSRTQIPSCDYWSPALSLATRFATTLGTIPGAIPYIRPDPQRVSRWRGKLPSGFKVGLVWKGSKQHGNDAQRSLGSLQDLAPLWDIAGVGFASLQKGEGEDEAKHASPAQPLIALGHEMADFADAAAIVSQLDLVICVDTAIAHLAGALGKQVWVLLPAIATDWRWLRDRDDSPWYPGVMRLFRQGEDAKWNPVIAKVARALHKEVDGNTNVQSLLEWSVAAHQAKRAHDALRGYEAVLAKDKDNADAWHLKGLIQHEMGQSAEAEKSIRRAIALKDSPLFLKNLAVLLKALGRSDEAQGYKARASAKA
ncbi:MAG TPA: tetratricopeptide repeat protein [Ramlibacter sp.]|nr:tetratricopeptide repeat protein [Ramlibacter sp.]